MDRYPEITLRGIAQRVSRSRAGVEQVGADFRVTIQSLDLDSRRQCKTTKNLRVMGDLLSARILETAPQTFHSLIKTQHARCFALIRQRQPVFVPGERHRLA